MSLSSIKHIARFEARTLVRGWLFRIFAILSTFVFAFFNIAAFTSAGSGISFHLVAGGVPYLNMFVLNIIQSVIVVFLSSDFLGRDKKLDTTEAFYVRSVSNFSYVIGKTAGIITVLFFLNLAVLLAGFVFNITSSITDLVPVTYLIYPLLLSLPSIVLVLGLSFFLMTLIKNQAVTFILMLGLLGAGLFYFGNKWYGVLDIAGFNTPMAYSIFTGLPAVENLLLVRGAYLLLGFGFIFFTVLMLPRLPQEKHFTARTVAGMVFTFIPATVMLTTFVIRNSEGEKLRAQTLQIEETLPARPSLQITRNDLSLTHTGNSVAIVARLTAFAESEENIAFVINRGFTVRYVKVNGSDVSFEQTMHIVLLSNSSIERGETVQIEIAYAGKPDERTTFPEIPEDTRTAEKHRLIFLPAGKQISYIQPNYVLLTREAEWYPVAASRSYRSYPQFTNFTIEAEVAPHLTAYSQGQKETAGQKVRFTPEKPLNALSFVAGEYETRSVMLDSVEVSLAVHADNIKFISNYFDELADTIPHLLAEMKGDYERKLGLPYPFKRFSLIEVPINFYTYPRNWTLATDDNMPEQLLIPERGGANIWYDPKVQERWGPADEIPSEKKIRTFKNILGGMIFTSSRMVAAAMGSQLRSLGSWNRHTAFPQYTAYTAGIEQDGFPAIQFIIENHLFSRTQNSEQNMFAAFFPSTDPLILKLQNNSLVSLLDSIKYSPSLSDIVSRKGAELFSIIQLNIEPQNIDDILNKMLNSHSFELTPVDTFMHRLDVATASALSPFVSNWLHSTTSPAFLFGNTHVSRINDGNRERFLIRMEVLNTGTGSGVLSIDVRGESGHGLIIENGVPRLPEASVTATKTFMIEAGQPTEIGIVSSSEPREITVNTFVARNLPVKRQIPVNTVDNRQVALFEGTRPFSGTVAAPLSGEYIVDNEDAGFSIISQQAKNTLKEWWMQRTVTDAGEKYKHYNGWMPSHKWVFLLNESYYGSYIKSAAYIRSGAGENRVQWQTELPESGNYTVYAYVPRRDQLRWGRLQHEKQTLGSYSFTVVHDDGEETVEVELLPEESGWRQLGDFYISKGTAQVVMSDKTSEQIAVADAVKWVKK